jgi:hypothetical protein
VGAGGVEDAGGVVGVVGTEGVIVAGRVVGSRGGGFKR